MSTSPINPLPLDDSWKSSAQPWGWALGLLTAVLLAAAGIGILQQLDQQQEQRLLKRLQQNQHLASYSFRITLDRYIEMTHELRYSLQADLAESSAPVSDAEFIEQAEVELRNAARVYPNLHQLRLLDLRGMEILRINNRAGEIETVTPHALQNKSERNYVLAGLGLEPNQIYLSNIDLNIENGLLQDPLQATLRIVTPISNPDGQRLGLLVVNLDMNSILQALATLMDSSPQQAHVGPEHILLVDDQGGLILDSDHPQQTFGLQRGHGYSFASRYGANTLQQIHATGEGGLLHTPFGWMLHQHIDLAMGGTLTAHSHSELQYASKWHLITRIDPLALAQRNLLHQAPTQTLLGALALIGFVTTYLLVLRYFSRRNERETLTDIYQNAPCGYQVLDTAGRVLSMNQTELVWLGKEANKVIGQPFHHLLTYESARRLEGLWSAIRENRGEFQGLPLTLQTQNGKHINVLLNSRGTNHEGGLPTRYRMTLVNTDIQMTDIQDFQLQTRTDPVTGLGNWQHLEATGERELLRSRTLSYPSALLLIQIQEFDELRRNLSKEQLHHLEREVGHVLRNHVDRTDTVSRTKHGVYAMYLVELSAAAANKVAERLQRSVAEAQLVGHHGKTVSVNVVVANAPTDRLTELSFQGLYDHALARLEQPENAPTPSA